jgi:hypothetical protein
MPRRLTTVFANIALAAVIWMLPLMAQSQNNDGADSLTPQWRSIADSVLTGVRIPVSGRMALVVETEKDRSLIENAFLASCERKGLRVMLTEEKGSAEAPLLRISGIVNFGPPSNEVSCEARLESGDGGARYLGRFHGASMSSAGAGGGSALERFIEPLVVIAGAIMIVYLFFTVRS